MKTLLYFGEMNVIIPLDLILVTLTGIISAIR